MTKPTINQEQLEVILLATAQLIQKMTPEELEKYNDEVTEITVGFQRLCESYDEDEFDLESFTEFVETQPGIQPVDFI